MGRLNFWFDVTDFHADIGVGDDAQRHPTLGIGFSEDGVKMEDHTTGVTLSQDGRPFSIERRITRNEPNAHIGYEAKIILNTDRTTVKRRVVINRESGKERRATEQPIRRGGGKRGRIFTFSRASCRNFKARANSIAGLYYMATMTYPNDEPPTADDARKDWDNLRRWLVKYGTYGIMMREFQDRGAIHYHFLTSEHLPVAELTDRWLRITGNVGNHHAERYAVLVKAMYDVAGAIDYLKKRNQKENPDGDESFGRIWTEFGKIQRCSTETFVGNQKAIAPLLRVLRGLDRASRRTRQKRQRNDKGIYGFTAWGVADKAFRARLPDLLKLFSLSAHHNDKTGETFLTLGQGESAATHEEGDRASV